MGKTLKKCSQCGAPIRVDRLIPMDQALCRQCAPNQAAAETQPKTVVTNERQATGYGLLLSSIGFVLVTMGGLVLTFSDDHVRQVPGGEFFRFLGGACTFFGLMALSIGTFLCMFTLNGSRATKPLLCSIIVLCVFSLLRLLEVSPFVRTRLSFSRTTSAVLAIVWLVAWAIYVGRTATAAGRRDLANRAFDVLLAFAFCLTIAGYLVWTGEFQSSDVTVQFMRLTIACLGLWMTMTVVRLSRHLLVSDRSSHDSLQTVDDQDVPKRNPETSY